MGESAPTAAIFADLPWSATVGWETRSLEKEEEKKKTVLEKVGFGVLAGSRRRPLIWSESRPREVQCGWEGSERSR